MSEPVTISKLTPALASMQYEELLELGRTRIQELCGKIWTDYNAHDPGITLLELLSFAISDIGYRMSFSDKDLFTGKSDSGQDYRNFFSAKEILPAAPLTIPDYRKLLMDVEYEYEFNGIKEKLGVKNAWLTVAEEAEIKIWVNALKNKLEHFQDYPEEESYFVKGLFHILLEFDRSETLGDLNSNKIKKTFTIENHPLDDNLEGVEIICEVSFPRWDEPEINFKDSTSVIGGIESITFIVEELPSGYDLVPNYNTSLNVLSLTGTRPSAGGSEPIPGIASIQADLNAFIFTNSDSLLAEYLRKIEVVAEIKEEVIEAFNNNRNLCEDLFKVHAMRIENILLCADIDIDNLADSAKVAAAILHDVGRFLSPDVYFYSLPEMVDKGLGMDDIFNAPPLQHGFIDDTELENADRMDCIHVSDLIRIIMDVIVDGKKPVKAVRNIQIANDPEDNDDGSVSIKSVKWALKLAVDEFYVPRISESQSKLNFFKGDLPLGYDQNTVEVLLAELRNQDRKRFVENPVLDRSIPQGDWRELTDYIPLNQDLPLTYGVGPEGLKMRPHNIEVLQLREARANQLRGYLAFFDQLLAGFLQQLQGVKELYSMAKGTDQSGRLLFDKTYFAASPIAADPYIENLLSNPDFAQVHIQQALENVSQFEERKNRFLDQLLARFCEQFSEYSLLCYSVHGNKAGSELIADKLDFLNKYPEISMERGQAFNYFGPAGWLLANTSGYEKRTSLLMGVSEKPAATLFFTPAQFPVTLSGSDWNYKVQKTAALTLLKGIAPFISKNAMLENMELVVACGVLKSNYKVIENTSLPGNYLFQLYADIDHTTPISISIKQDYLTENLALLAIEKCIEVCTKEYLNQPGSNRKNLAPPILPYFKYTVSANMVPSPPLFLINFSLYDTPFAFTNPHKLLSGVLKGEAEIGDTNAQVIQKGKDSAQQLIWDFLRVASDEENYSLHPPYQPNGPGYEFRIYKNGVELAQSYKKNFNKPLADIIENSLTPVVSISNSTANNGAYTVNNAVANGPFIRLHVDENPPSTLPDGIVTFTETYACSTIISENTIVIIGSDLTQKVFNGNSIMYTGISGEMDGVFTIKSITFVASKTIILVEEKIYCQESGTASYKLEFAIKNITPDVITIKALREQMAIKNVVDFINGNILEREGIHLLEHVLLRPRYSTFSIPPDPDSDALLSIQTDAECDECSISDVYSFIMSVVLPYWPAKFREKQMRAYIEKTARLEAPAHVAMNICWINPTQMFAFELAYKKWLIATNTAPLSDAISDQNACKNARIDALKELIEILEALRSIYPEGKLHSCDEAGNDSLSNAVILNNTMLGTM